MNQHLRPTNALVTSVKERLAATASFEPAKALDDVVEALTQRYASIEIYLAVEDVGVCRSSSRQSLRETTMADVNSEIAVPIMLGAKTLGLVVAETGKRNTRQERAALQQVAELIAEYVAASRGKQARGKTSDKLHAAPVSAAKPKGPQSARAAVRKAAAGDHFSR